MLRISVFLCYQVFSSPNKVIKMVLSLLFFAVIVPRQPFFPTASDMGYYENPLKIIEKNHVFCSKFWLFDVAEAAIGGELG
jgi:hypothetical protein